MKFCPKCRSFYDDEGLVFCQTDGIPLVKLNQSSELWREGTEAIQATREIVHKEIRLQKLKKIAKVSVTIVITMLVITERVRNTDFDSPTGTVEKANNSSPVPIVKSVESNVAPKKIKTIVNNSVNSNVNNPKCEESAVILSVKNNNFEKWNDELKSQENLEKEKFSKVHNDIPVAEIIMTLNFTEDNIKVVPSSDCLSATATVNYSWTVEEMPKYKIVEKNIPRELLSHNCRKNSGWKCE